MIVYTCNIVLLDVTFLGPTVEGRIEGTCGSPMEGTGGGKRFRTRGFDGGRLPIAGRVLHVYVVLD